MRTRTHAFTLIELLVVISIIALLIGILLPALGAARSSAISIQSKSQLRQFGTAFLTYATDHGDELPLNFSQNARRFPTWLTDGTSALRWWINGPDNGTLFDYVGQSAELYRSPALETGQLNSGVGSNGKYDYSTIAAFNGANLANISSQAEVHPAAGDANDTIDAPTPLMVEEDPAAFMNNGWPDSAHTGGDLLGAWHTNGTGNYTAVDGSTHTFDPSFAQKWGRQVRAEEWYSRAPSGRMVSLGRVETIWDGDATAPNPVDRGNAPFEPLPQEWGTF